jgi:type I restriction enzyme, R subunit
LKVAPLLRFVAGINNDELFFISKMEKCGLLHLQKRDASVTIESIKEDVSLLPTNLGQVKEHLTHINDILSNTFWNNVPLSQIDEKKEILAPIMRYKRERPSLIFELGLDDYIEARKWVIIRKDNQKIYVEEYRKKIEDRILKLAADNPVITKLKSGEVVPVEDLIKLEKTLGEDLRSDDISLDEENMRKAFGLRVGNFVDFLKHILNIEQLPTYEEIVRKSFDSFILEHNYNADQSRFLRAVQNFFIQHHKLDTADLYEPPFTNFGVNAVEKLFGESDVKELIQLTNNLVA